MKLYLLRHGQAEYKSSTGKDIDRKLSDVGEKQVAQVKERLEQEVSEKPFLVLCSTADRTTETYEGVKKAIKIQHEHFDKAYYLADLHTLLNLLWNIDDDAINILFIGHNNGISDIASYLTDQSIKIPTSGLVIIDFPDFDQLQETGLGTGTITGKCFPSVE
jgi:phosphohistidine phosphatase